MLQGHKDRLYSGGKDGKVKVWYYSSVLMPRADLFYFFDHVGMDIPVSSIMFKPNSEILIASTTGKVFEIGEVGSVTLKEPKISTRVNGFAINNLRKEIIVTSEDSYVQCWNYTTFEITKSKHTGMPHHAVTYYREYSRILIADQKGKINIWRDNQQMDCISKIQSCFTKPEERITDIQLSTSGRFVSVTARRSPSKLDIFEILES